MKVDVYISDEGFGPIVRQSAILSQLRLLMPELDARIITDSHLDQAKRVFEKARFERRFNNITWHKDPQGSPDIAAIESYYSGYLERLADYGRRFTAADKADLVISDFVYEGFGVAKANACPAFGVAHFTWDWFFNSLNGYRLPEAVLREWTSLAASARRLYFPPFTPPAILKRYRKNAVEVPLIVRARKNMNIQLLAGEFRVLVIDSGAGVLRKQIEKALPALRSMTGYRFFVSDAFQVSSANFTAISRDELFVDYIPHMDLVIGRAGFNTISECIAYRTPMLLLSETLNPEMDSNIAEIRNSGLGAFIHLNDFVAHPHRTLEKFIKNEYSTLRRNMDAHNIACNGHEVVAGDILGVLQST